MTLDGEKSQLNLTYLDDFSRSIAEVAKGNMCTKCDTTGGGCVANPHMEGECQWCKHSHMLVLHKSSLDKYSWGS
jgi:DNA polymerase II large subunit